MLKKKNGITLIALIITIIVMLILVGVTINVALNGGLFSKAEKAAYQTKVSTIKEQVEIERAIQLADNNGKISIDHGITVNSLSIADELKTEFGTKLVISNDVKLYYDKNIVTNAEEQEWLEEIGIIEYVNDERIYSFTLNGITNAFTERDTNGYLHYNATEFWEIVGTNLAGQYGINPSNGQIIGPISFSSDKLTTDLSSAPAIGSATFVFYESGEEVIIALVYAHDDGDAAPSYITYEQALEQFGDITIYFGEI